MSYVNQSDLGGEQKITKDNSDDQTRPNGEFNKKEHNEDSLVKTISNEITKIGAGGPWVWYKLIEFIVLF